jgi:hypothetical protein
MTRGRPFLAGTRCGDWQRAVAHCAHGKSCIFVVGFPHINEAEFRLRIDIVEMSLCQSFFRCFFSPAEQGLIGPPSWL